MTPRFWGLVVLLLVVVGVVTAAGWWVVLQVWGALGTVRVLGAAMTLNIQKLVLVVVTAALFQSGCIEAQPKAEIVNQAKTLGIRVWDTDRASVEYTAMVRNNTDEPQIVFVQCRVPLVGDSLTLVMNAETIGAGERQTLRGIAPLPQGVPPTDINGEPDCWIRYLGQP